MLPRQPASHTPQTPIKEAHFLGCQDGSLLDPSTAGWSATSYHEQPPGMSGGEGLEDDRMATSDKTLEEAFLPSSLTAPQDEDDGEVGNNLAHRPDESEPTAHQGRNIVSTELLHEGFHQNML